MLIRPATAGDLPAVTAIANALLATTTYEWTETPHTVDERARWLRAQEEASHPVLVAVDQTVGADQEKRDEVMGWGTYGDFRDSTRWPGYRITVEHSIHVDQVHWGKGVGRALIAALADHARAANKLVMVAAIDASNVRSIEFHSRLGFREVARMPGVGEKWGQRRELVLMQFELDQDVR